MATSLMCVNLPSILSPISTETCQNREKMVTGFGLSKTSFLCGNTKKLFSSQSKRVLRFRKFKPLIAARSFNHIPKQFREENLKEGLMENYKNVPELIYGLSPSQMDMFATKDSPIFRQSAKLNEESLTSAKSYSDSCPGWNMSGMKDGGQSTYGSMKVSMYRGGYGRTRGPPPDLPSLLLDARIVFLGLPLVDEVYKLILAQLIYLHFDDPDKPVYLYLNCLGVKNEQSQIVAEDLNAYGVAIGMDYFKAGVYTVNIGVAYGQAAMLLSRGKKGHRFLMPSSTTKLYLPSKHRMTGTTTAMYYQAKNLKTNVNTFLGLLSEGTGKSADVLRQDLLKAKCFDTQGAIDYGIADQLVASEKRLMEEYDVNWAKKSRFGGGFGGVGGGVGGRFVGGGRGGEATPMGS